MYYGRPGRGRRLRRHYGTFLRPGDLAFDIGAHLGDRTRCWSQLGATVVALEPQPQFARALRWQFQGSPRVIVEPMAVGARPGTATLHASRRTPTVTTLSTDWIASVRKAESFARVRWDQQVQVPVTTLDVLIERFGVPRFCKIDVEGYEAEVLRGLSRPLPAVSMEYVPVAIEVALEAVGLLQRLGHYRFNVSLGEALRFEWPDWRGPDEIRAWLQDRNPDETSGDVYARLED